MTLLLLNEGEAGSHGGENLSEFVPTASPPALKTWSEHSDQEHSSNNHGFGLRSGYTTDTEGK